MASADPINEKKRTVEVPPSLKKRLRAASNDHDIPIKEIVRQSLEAWLEKNEKVLLVIDGLGDVTESLQIANKPNKVTRIESHHSEPVERLLGIAARILESDHKIAIAALQSNLEAFNLLIGGGNDSGELVPSPEPELDPNLDREAEEFRKLAEDEEDARKSGEKTG